MGGSGPDDGADDGGELPEAGRNETEWQRLDRNFAEILQELRVTQTGTQILTGFLLAVAFQNRFTDLTPFQVDVYLVLVVLAAVATALGLAPVSLHRALYRRGEKDRIVAISSMLLDVILLCVAACITGVVLLIFDVVASLTAAIVAASCVLVGIAVLWYVFPRRERRRPRA